MIQTFKIIKGIEDIPSERFFKVCKESSTRGHSLKLEKPRCKTTIRQRHFSQRIINDWNSLPERVVAAKDVNQFKMISKPVKESPGHSNRIILQEVGLKRS